MKRSDVGVDAAGETLGDVLGVARTVHASVPMSSRPTEAIYPTPIVRGAAAPSRYDAREHLGSGGMGVVDAIWDADLMREVAVKRLRPELRDDAQMLTEFLWEARVMAHLDHPNILPIHDLAIGERGTLFFTMKRVRGRSLEAALADARRPDDATEFSLARRLRTFVQICHAVAFAHGRGVLHRDLKPANVMLGDHGEVVVMDWGLARPLGKERAGALHSLREGTSAGPSGTPLYMSPEQVKGAALDERSDIYALGVMLFELASLESPYRASTLATLLAQIVDGEVRPFEDVMREPSPSLAAVVRRAMALEPSDRYATVIALRDDVERVLDGLTPSAEHASFVRRAARAYMTRDRGLARLRVFDFEQLLAASALTGAAATGLVVSDARWPWLFALGAFLCWIPPTLRWLRERRRGDA